MAEKKHGTTVVNLQDSPPQPVGGDGEVLMTIGEQDVIVRWQGGEIVDSRPASDDGASPIDIKVTTDAIQCYKCWVDTDSGAWICLPTAC